jgi:hypothetical protein
VYDVPQPVIENGQVKNAYAVDGFPEQLHKPITDHDDFINVMSDQLMSQVVDCINTGRQCGGDGGDPSQATPAPSSSASSGGDSGAEPGTGGGQQTAQPPAGTPGTGAAGATGTPGTGASGGGSQDDHGGATVKVYPTPEAARSEASATPRSASDDDHAGQAAGSEKRPSTGGDISTPVARTEPQAAAGGDSPSAASTPSTAPAPPQTEPQAVTGGLAETGAHLWPAAAGAVLLIVGLLLLRRTGRRSM